MKASKKDSCVFMLRALGLEFVTCFPAQGHWKKKSADVYAWEFIGVADGVRISGGCYATMTECCRARRLRWADRELGEVAPIVLPVCAACGGDGKLMQSTGNPKRPLRAVKCTECQA